MWSTGVEYMFNKEKVLLLFWRVSQVFLCSSNILSDAFFGGCVYVVGCLCLASQLCLTLCNPMDSSTPGLPVHHQLLKLTQTHVHWVSDAIQPSHLLSSPSPPFPSFRVFSSESILHIRWPKLSSLAFLNLELLTPALWGLTCHCFKSGIPESNQTNWVWVPAQLLPGSVTMRKWSHPSEN